MRLETYPRGHFQLAFVAAESGGALANVTAESVETGSTILASVQQAVIDLGFAPFPLVPGQHTKQNQEKKLKFDLKSFRNNRTEKPVPVAGAGEIVDSVQASAAVEAHGRMETVVRVV